MAVRHELMRFTGLDTAQLLRDPGQQMGYGYVSGNPVVWNDLLGLVTWPVSSGEVTSDYGDRVHPTTGEVSHHDGVDLRNPMGAPVVSTGSGYVYTTRQGDKGDANSVTIQYDDGTAGAYSHVTSDLKKDERVDEGQEIGTTDTSGRSTGPHLHYEHYTTDGEVDPMGRLNNADPYPGTETNESSMTNEKMQYLNRHVPC